MNAAESGGTVPCLYAGCRADITHKVSGLPGNQWGGFYCLDHVHAHRGHYDHQGGFRYRKIGERAWTTEHSGRPNG